MAEAEAVSRKKSLDDVPSKPCSWICWNPRSSVVRTLLRVSKNLKRMCFAFFDGKSNIPVNWERGSSKSTSSKRVLISCVVGSRKSVQISEQNTSIVSQPVSDGNGLSMLNVGVSEISYFRRIPIYPTHRSSFCDLAFSKKEEAAEMVFLLSSRSLFLQ